jgi:uncharacterized repeat protein (TIGR01451 family)
MKKLIYLIALALILGLVLTGCSLLSNVGQVPTTGQSGITYLTKGPTFTVGNDDTVRPNTDSYSNFTIIDTNNSSSELGLLNTFSYYAKNSNPFRFVLVDESDVVQWVSAEITPSAPLPGVQSWSPSIPVYVEPDWNLGLYFALAGTVTWEYAGAPAWYEPNKTGLPNVGDTLFYASSSNRIYSFVATGEVADLPSVPIITWPTNNAYITAAALTHIDWTDSTGTFTPLEYQYQAYGDAGYTAQIYSSGWLSASEIPTLNTPEGVYYIRVRAQDSMGYLSDWSNGVAQPYKITVILPSIEIDKTASTTAAAPGETVTYTYTVTTDGALSDVTVSDNPAGDAEYVSGDTNSDGVLYLDETWIFTINYIIPEDAPEYLCNIATAEGWYKGNSVSADSNEVCIHTMGARTIGYWKTHLEVWEEFEYMELDQSDLLSYFPGSGAQANGVNPLEMLRAQLTAAALNVFYFDGDFDYSRYEDDLCGYGTIYEVIADAEAFLG